MKYLKQNGKRCLALVMVLAMCLSMLQMSAFAAEEEASDHAHNPIDCMTCAGTGLIAITTECPDCDGPAEAEMITCETCDGDGWLGKYTIDWDTVCPVNGAACDGCDQCYHGYGLKLVTWDCDACNGAGRYVDPEFEACETCGGMGTVSVEEPCAECEEGKIPCSGYFDGGVLTSVNEDGLGVMTHTCPDCGASYETELSEEETAALLGEGMEVAGLSASAVGAKQGDDVIFTLKVRNSNYVGVNGVSLKLELTEGLEADDADENGYVVFDNVSIGSGETKEFQVRATLTGETGTTSSVSLAEMSMGGAVISTDTVTANVRVNRYSAKTVTLAGLYMAHWNGYVDGTAAETKNTALDNLIDKPFTVEELAPAFAEQFEAYPDWWGEYAVNEANGKTWRCVGFVPSSRYTADTGDLSYFVFSDDPRLAFTEGDLDDALQFIEEQNGVLYGETASVEQLDSWEPMLNNSLGLKLVAVWYVPDTRVQPQEHSPLTIESVTPVVFEEPSSDGVTFRETRLENEGEAVQNVYITVDIDENAPTDAEVIVNLAGIPKLSVLPGDCINYHITIQDNSGRNYRFVPDSAVLGTFGDRFENGWDDKETIGNGFDGSSIPYGSNDSDKTAIPKRVINAPLKELGVTDDISDEAIGSLLREYGYAEGDEDLSDAKVTQTYLSHYYLDYLNVNTHKGDPIDSFQDASDGDIRLLFNDVTTYGNMHAYESCAEVAEAYYYFFYGRMYKFNGTPLYNHMVDTKELNVAIEEALADGDGDYGFTLETNIDGDLFANAAQGTVLSFRFGLKFELEPAAGALTIQKVLDENAPEAAAEQEFRFIVTGPDGYEQAVTITGADSVTLEGLAPGGYTVTEDAESAAIEGYTWTNPGEVSVTVVADETARAVITNTYTPTETPTESPTTPPAESPDPSEPPAPSTPTPSYTPAPTPAPGTPNEPEITIPEPSVPVIDVPEEDIPLVEQPEVIVPDEDAPLAELPEVVIPDEDAPLAELPEVIVPDEDVPLAELPEVVVPDEDVPLAELPKEEIEIPEEKVPLADVPATGDNASFWALLAVASGLGLAGLAMDSKKRGMSK